MWTSIKQLLRDVTGLSEPMLHISFGLAGFCLVLLLTRRAWLSLGVVAALQLGNEMLDLRDDLQLTGQMDASALVTDTLLTLALPALVALVISELRRSRERRAE